MEFADKWLVCRESNAEGVAGGIAEALRGADVCIAFARSDPGLIKPEWVKGMAREAIVFACANPLPEIWPWEAKEAGARVVGTGRGDFPNQAVATAMKAQEQGVARLSNTRDQLHQEATRIIRQAREATQLLMREGLIPLAP